MTARLIGVSFSFQLIVGYYEEKYVYQMVRALKANSDPFLNVEKLKNCGQSESRAVKIKLEQNQ